MAIAPTSLSSLSIGTTTSVRVPLSFGGSDEIRIAQAPTPQGALLSVLQSYQASGEFNGLAARTRRDYIEKIKVIEAEFGDFPLSALTDRRTRGIFMAWRDRLAAKSRRQADYAWQVIA
jgi:hypothetical protein